MKINYILLLTFLTISCGSGGGSDVPPTTEPPAIAAPKATTLIFPANNTECNEGTALTGNVSQTQVTFRWMLSEDTDSYEVNLKNLLHNNTSKFNSNTNELAINIDKGAPFEWFVISKNTSSITASSSKFRFYNQGDGVQNYAPFPAEVVSPARGSTIANNSTILLKWLGGDIDNDILNYTVIFDNINPPLATIGTTTNTEISANILSGQVYYWQVVTKDTNQNSSQSEVFEFKVQ
jgi:hypothetical protein